MSRGKTIAFVSAGATLALALFSGPSGLFGPSLAVADPCGMVPPLIIPENRVAIERVGAQRTFVSHYRGVETMVLRPAFKGEIDSFGMLIPFPSPPAIRKVDDDIFTHLANAVEPPEVVAYVQAFRGGSGRRARPSKSAPASEASADRDDSTLGFNTVRVVNREAVGMYDVAVLEAGSSVALKRWMDDNGFRYPSGMEAVTQDYVDIGWFFVAVKTQVGQKSGVNPRPGMKSANAKLPKGSTFTGAVQGMGFRFKSKELVVPMRLSAFNAGKKRNVVYILTDKPTQINRLPTRHVVRQISGAELYRNLTGPLPLRVIGGTYNQLGQWQKKQLKTNRNPERYNGLAKELIAGDMLAIRRGRLANPIEETEKELLAIGEALGMRGKALDTMHRTVLAKKRGAAEDNALRAIRNLHLTVVDGEFPKNVIATDNLTFARYKMPRTRNTKKNYDAPRMGPGSSMGGRVYRSSIETLDKLLVNPNADRAAQNDLAPSRQGWFFGGGIGLGMVMVFGGLLVRRRKSILTIFAAFLIGGLALSTATAHAQLDARTSALIAKLDNVKTSKSAVLALVKRGDRAVDDLVDFVARAETTPARGWAIVALGRIGGERARAALRQLATRSNSSDIVGAWTRAALIVASRTEKELLEMSNLVTGFPAVQKPYADKLTPMLLSRTGGKGRAAKLLGLMSTQPVLRSAIGQAVMKLSTRDLVSAMIGAKSDNNVRRMAAATLGSVASTRKDVPRELIRALRFRPDAKNPPWGKQALFIPGIAFDQKQARELMDVLLRWHLWADINGESGIQNQIHNNLRSNRLINAAKVRSPGWNNVGTVQWLSSWSDVVGIRAIRTMLRQQDAHRLRRYRSLTGSL